MKQISIEPSVAVVGLPVRMPQQVVRILMAEIIKLYCNPADPQSAGLREVVWAHVDVPEVAGGIQKANPGQVRRALEQVWHETPALTTAIFTVWSSRHSALMEVSRACMNSPSPEVEGLIGTMRSGDESINAHVLADIARIIAKEHSGMGSLEEIWLASALTLPDLPQPTPEPEPEGDTEITMNQPSETKGSEPMEITEWGEILNLLQRIAPDDPRWLTFDAFQQAAYDIANQKREALEKQNRVHNLALVFDRCHPLIVAQAAYFEIEDAQNWSINNVDPGRIGEAVQAVETLHTRLDEFVQLKDSLNRSQRFQAEEQIVQGYEIVRDFFSGHPAASLVEMMQPVVAGTPHLDEEEAPSVEDPQSSAPDDHAMSDPLTVEEPLLATVEDTTPAMEETAPVQDEPGALCETDETKLENLLKPESGLLISLDEDAPTEEEITVAAEDHGEVAGEPETDPGFKATPSSNEEDVVPAPSLPDDGNDRFPSYPVEELEEEDEEVEEEQAGEPPAFEESGGEGTLLLPEESGSLFNLTGRPLPEVSDEEANAELLRRLNSNDLSSAYWLAWAGEQMGRAVPFPSWLIAAMQGALWSGSLWPNHVLALSESITEIIQPETRLFENTGSTALFGLAVGLHFNLIDTAGRWSSWLDVALPDELPGLARIIEAVKDNRDRGNVLDPLMVQLMWDRDEVDRRAKETANRVDAWLRQAGEKGARIVRASKVWQEMVRPGRGELSKWLDPVAHDQRSKVGEVERQLEHWKDRATISTMIHHLDQQINGRRPRPIDGEARDQIIGWVDDVSALARDWCNTVNSLTNVQGGKAWAYDQSRQLSETLQMGVNEALDEVAGAAKKEGDPSMRISLHMIQQSLLGIKGMTAPKHLQPSSGQPEFAISRPVERNFRGMLAQTLLMYPEVDLDSTGMPVPEKAADLRSAVITFQNRRVEEVLQGWMDLHDYRFVDALLDKTSNPEEWETRIREMFREDIQRLERWEIPETIVAIEQALLETLIAEGEYTEYVSRVESVRKQVRQSEFSSVKRISVRKLSNRLLEIRDELKANRSRRLARQREHWEKLRVRLSEVAQDTEGILKFDEAFRSRIEQAVDKSFREGDLRAAGEYLAHLEASIALPMPRLPDEAVFDTGQDETPRYLADFINRLPEYVQMLKPWSGLSWSNIINEVGDPNSTLLDIPSGSLPGPRREEAKRAMQAWRSLKSSQPEQGTRLTSNVSSLMQYLGFETTTPSPVSVLSLPPGMRDYGLWRVSASAGVFAPVAQFGSQRKGFYQVLGVWNRPGMETLSAQISALLQRTGDEPTIVFYFHYLTAEQRRALFSVTRRNNLPILVIDETLILHLARERENRLRTMFACTLPFAALNPYFPDAAGMVPPEVYKGREGLVRDLINPQGSIIVFGGRQLGKSALLRQVEREFHQPNAGRIVIYEDIKLVGAVGEDKDYQIDLRDRLASKLIGLGLLPPSSASENIDSILTRVEQKVNGKHLQIRLLLDESDNFLNADALRNFPVVQKLKNVMEETNHSFKFILAGLHNVQRFGRIPNHPLAHLGDPIQIGPLPSRPARDLLMEPLHALGFHFGNDLSHEDTSLPLHILSYTNRHPGLIQFFGSALVKHMLEKHQAPSQPPLRITRADVEQVYRKKEVRDKICERFNLTLDLDPRYTAITLTMILEQWDDQNGFDRLYSAQLLREKAASWWPKAFGEEAITPEGFKGVLEEMVGLGVLAVGQDENSFRLRSPNLVYLMGTHEEIWDRMTRLSETLPPGQSALNSHHARLENLYFSPFTFGQERVLNNPRSGVALIFGTNASGLGNLEDALRRLPIAKSRLCPVRIAARGADAVLQQLKQSVREHPESGLLIAHREMEGSPEQMADEVQAAIQYCSQVKDPTLRVCFSFDPHAAWQWFQLPVEFREQLEERALVMSLQCWDRIGVQQRLEMETSVGGDIMVSDRLLTRVVEATGGWMTLMDAYIAECRSKEPAAALEKFQQSIRSRDSVLVKQFITELGVYEQLPRELVGVLQDTELRKMVREEPVFFLDFLGMMIKDRPKEVVKNAVDYLQRLSIIVNEPYPELDPVIFRCWNAC